MTAQDAEYTRVPASPPTPHVNGQVEVWESVQWETLRVGYWHEGPFGRALEREWGDDHLLDSHVYDGNGLTVIGLDEAPETYGTFAAGCGGSSSGRWSDLTGCAVNSSRSRRGASQTPGQQLHARAGHCVVLASCLAE